MRSLSLTPMNSSSKFNSAYRFDDIVVDCDGLCLEKGGQKRKITPRAFDVLVYLVQHPGRIIEKQELFDEVWKEKFVTDNALTRIIKEVRQAIGDDANAPQYIETVPKHGYRFIAEVKAGEEAAQTHEAAMSISQQGATGSVEPRIAVATREEISAAKPGDASATLVAGWPRLFLGVAIALAVIAVVAITVWKSQTTRGPSEIPGVLRTTKITYSPGLDIYPAISPDGNSVVYCSDQSGGFEIYVKQLVPGSREIQLTSDGKQNLEPAWSPDRRLIAYYSRDRGGIWVMPALGGAARQIAEFGSRPAWSPDGSMIAFQSEPLSELLGFHIGSSTIWIVSAQGGNAKPITQVGNPTGGHGVPSWSPDGKRIVFVSREITEATLWTVSIEDAGLKQITRSRNIYDPTYSPDGQYIYYPAVTSGSGFGLWKARISPASDPLGEPVLVVDPGSASFAFPTISADGKKLAYALLSSTSNLWSVPLSPSSSEATGSPAPITNDTSLRNTDPAFSPDGRKIAFGSTRSGPSDIWLVDADGKNPVQLTTDPARDGLPSWFPEGDRISFASDRSGHSALWSTTLTGGRDTLFLDVGQDMGYARLSPDGKQVAFQSRKDGVINIWTAALEGGQPKRLTFDKELMGWPCWSPDGKLLGLEMRRGDDTHIAIMPSNGGTPTPLTFDRGQNWPHDWSPDGDKISFAGLRNGYWNVWWVSRTTKQQKQVTSYRKLNAFVRYPTWSPLGNQIVYEYNETTGNIWLMELK
jgi:Tol biopolymer transport system component/DNA-binding winged helix-turn-helix (wHTH) protein